MKKFIVLSIVLLMLAGFAITSSALVNLEVDLVVGRKLIPVGTLTVVEVNGNLVITYAMDPVVLDEEGWELLETHLYIGTAPPEKSAPGWFPYDAIDGVYEIDLTADFPDVTSTTTFYIAAQAEIGKIDDEGETVLDPPEIGEQIEETTWAFGVDKIRPGKNWAMYFGFVYTPPTPD